MKLTVTQAFADYRKGDTITDPVCMDEVLAENPHHVVRTFHEPEPAPAVEVHDATIEAAESAAETWTPTDFPDPA